MEKYEYLTGKNLGHRQSVIEKTKFEYSPLGMSLRKSFEKDSIKNTAKSKSDFNYDYRYRFYKLYKRYDEFEEMSLDSQYNCIKKFSILMTNFKNLLKDQKIQKCNSKRSEL